MNKTDLLANERKNEYRRYFQKIAPYIRMTMIFSEFGIKQPNWASFMKGNNNYMSEENLELVKQSCIRLGKEMLG